MTLNLKRLSFHLRVERRYGNLKFLMKSSPANGKIRMESAFLYATASLGPDSHLFVRSNSRRIHYNGSTFVVRNGTQSAGFDEQSQLKLW